MGGILGKSNKEKNGSQKGTKSHEARNVYTTRTTFVPPQHTGKTTYEHPQYKGKTTHEPPQYKGKTTLEHPQHKGCNEVELLSRTEKISMNLALSFTNLLLNGHTLPFIARYRKSAVDYLMPNRLLELYESFTKITRFKKKVDNVVETLRKSQKLTPAIEYSIYNAQNSAELDLVYAPLKSQTISPAEQARKLGLEDHALRALNGEYVDMRLLCTHSVNITTVAKVEAHITHLIADIIYKDLRVLHKLRRLKEETKFIIQSRQIASSAKATDENKKNCSKSDPATYDLYFDWQSSSDVIKSYQILALNRAESENILSVKVIIPDAFYNKLEIYCLSLWKSKQWVSRGLRDVYDRYIKSWLARKVRSDLTAEAQKEAVKTFSTNLEKYLLTEPIKNKIIAGLDPGFKAGCKVGIINSNGDKLTACTIYPYLRDRNPRDRAAKQLINLLVKYQVDLIGLGNGTACRETESWLKYHRISTIVQVIIVPEQGASVYSISKEAQQEHPNMDPNLISALSLARRVMDPLGELIKVEPKNLGVGLYQHDIPAKMLESALDCTVEKVVSLVGVDLNTASHAMLRRISGLNEDSAGKIISYRKKYGNFRARTELYNILGFEGKTFEQCAGFLRVIGGFEPLDATIIHPESYSIAKLFAIKIGVNIKELTQPHFPRLVELKIAGIDLNRMSKDLGTDVSTLELIINAFKQKTYEDNIITFCRPVYSVETVDQVQEGTTLTGVVRNVVPFGCFVDCGLDDDGLIHTKNMGASRQPELGERVIVTVIPSVKPKKIQLKLNKIID